MESFLINCPHCGVMTARDLPCPSCGQSLTDDQPVGGSEDTVALFAQRNKVHTRNYAIYMVLQLAAGLVGMLTVVMWVLVIRRGSLVAFGAIGLLTVLSAVLTGLLFCAKNIFPTELLCPSCNVQLDQIGAIGSQCPSCYAQLKA